MKKTILAGFILLMAFAGVVRAEFEQAAVAYAMGQYGKAFETMLPLAETANHPYAQYYLGVMYANGQGVDKDAEAAGKWFSHAAKQGVSQAQFRLGELYAAGQGVPKDFEQAYAWYSVAAHLGHKQASTALESTSRQLSNEEIAEAKRLAEEYIANYAQRPEGFTR
jgi:TPR repeat protein